MFISVGGTMNSYCLLERARAAGCSNEEFAALASDRQTKQYNAGDVLFGDGDAVENILCIHNGRVALVKRCSGNPPVTLHVAGAGEMLGVAAALGSGRHSTGAVAIEPTTICLVKRTRFLDITGRYPALVWRVMQGMCSRLETLEHHIQCETGE
ncbi:MAG TPA: cyclic nucleotide-binding domain-containing protein [Candidatus Kapabacteria bacterium]|nr:cyclic nucleotide-binding domain-containing protein [Candidatus Kapabacteria bacterium]